MTLNKATRIMVVTAVVVLLAALVAAPVALHLSGEAQTAIEWSAEVETVSTPECPSTMYRIGPGSGNGDGPG